MTVDEIFRDISAHMTKGIMLHEQMADYYDFLNLHGYKRAHEYHMCCELKFYRKIHRYFLNHYNKLIEETMIENPDAIPASWYRYTRFDVDQNTKRTAVKAGIDKWVSWEIETKALYEKMYKELVETGEVAAAEKIMCLVKAVDKELKYAQRKQLCLSSADYSLDYIVMEQDCLHDKYKDKMEHIYDKH